MQIKLCTRTALDVFKANCMHYMMHMMGDVERVIELEGASERGRQPRENPWDENIRETGRGKFQRLRKQWKEMEK